MGERLQEGAHTSERLGCEEGEKKKGVHHVFYAFLCREPLMRGVRKGNTEKKKKKARCVVKGVSKFGAPKPRLQELS